MRLSFSSLLLACAATQLVSAAPQRPAASLAPLPAASFAPIKPLSLEEIQRLVNKKQPAEPPAPAFQAFATCGNPRTRMEWDSASTTQRTNYVNAIRCLMGRPRSGNFPRARNRYEDLVALHQDLTNNVHQNAKFLLWHRYYLWVFEDMLRAECGYNAGLLWFDESRYAGRFQESSIFSNQYFGSVAIGGRCVTDGVFRNMNVIIGPGSGSQLRCLSRNHRADWTANTNSGVVSNCNNINGYADMARCSEGGAHAWGHNGIGGEMLDMFSSPGDPVFFLHHAFIDRNYRIWQNANSARTTYVDGTDRAGNRLTLDTSISVNGIRPNVRIRDVLNTMDTTLCYRYNY